MSSCNDLSYCLVGLALYEFTHHLLSLTTIFESHSLQYCIPVRAYISFFFFFSFSSFHSLISFSILQSTRDLNPGYGSYPKPDCSTCISLIQYHFLTLKGRKVKRNIQPRATRSKDPSEKLGPDCLEAQELVSVEQITTFLVKVLKRREPTSK